MTITEHIQGIADDIAVQRSEIGRLKSKHTSLTGAFLASTALLMINLILVTPTLGYTLPFAIITLLSGSQWTLINKEIARINVLLAQNMFYRELIIEETYSGRNDTDQA